ncbi:MAG: peptidase M61, partial [Polyangiales bacterium]
MLTGAVHAQTPVRSEPQPIAAAAPIAAPRDVSYPGVITVDVDATDLERRVFRVRQRIPVAAAGPSVLLYSRWIPGHHGPSGALHDYAGLTITANGKRLAWQRDPADVFVFHVDVPAGVTALDLEAQYLSPTDDSQGAVAMTREILRLNWYYTMLYPAGHFMRRIQVDASVKLPVGWSFGSALEVASQAGGVVKFKRVSVETLVDSPLIAGKHFSKIDLDPKGRSRVTLNLAADEPQYLAAKPEIIDLHRALVREADALYGARHFDHYDFLLTLSDRIAGSGLEHARSSDNGTKPKYFTTWDKSHIARDLLGHEYNHSWCGKYRRPADLWTPNLNVPMRDSLLWVYEGQTQYYGTVLSNRAGFYKREAALDHYALFAGSYEERRGRRWRPLQDTTNDPIITSRRPIPWMSWQRSEDYYVEGAFIWL